MLEAKLIQLLRKFTTRQRTRFKEYVHSPYFNKHKTVMQLCNYLLKYAPDFEHKDLSKQQVFQHLFPKKTYSETKLYTYSSNLLSLLNDFLAVEIFKQETLLEKTKTLQAIRQLDHPKQFNTCTKQHQLLQKQTPFKNSSFYYQQYLFHEEQNLNFLGQNRRQYDSHLQAKSDALDIFYLEEKLKTACDMLSRNQVIQANYRCWGIEEVTQQLEKRWEYYQAYPNLVLYYQILKMLKEGSEEKHYYQLKQSLQENADHVQGTDLQHMYDYAINYCVRKLNTGNPIFYKEFFDLHKILLENKILTQAGYLSVWDYTNIATAGIRLGEFEWVEGFIQEYKELVPESSRENAYIYNLAYLYYSTSRYKETLGLLHEVEFSDPSYYLRTKIIQLKSYYALDELEAALSLLSALKSFLNRNKDLPEYMKNSNGNMIKMAKKLIKLSLSQNFWSAKKRQARIEQYEHELTTLSPMTNQDWLKEILAEII
ncbi:MAG: hypothetical protein MK212_12575 [Saprospiraceae bacterium]|nr:hypothetical protein [Saprospiraceae bacterium]